MEKKEEVGRDYFDPKSVGEQSVQVQGDGFSLAELQEWSVFCRRCSVHLSLLGPVINGSFLLKLFCWGL